MSSIKFIKNENLLKEKVNHQTSVFKEVILKKGIVPNLLQLAKAKFQTGDLVEKHYHDRMYEIFHVIKGELLVVEDNKKTKVSEGDTFVVFPKQDHSLEILEDSELIYFNIESAS